MKILITLHNNDIAPRFDLTTEVLIARIVRGKISGEPRTILLPGPSSDELCSLAIKEEVSLVICGGIEDAHFQYLNWKKIEVIDRIIGSAKEALTLAIAKTLQPGAIIWTRPDRSTTP
jgi:predicted Fe-Mo cluster-binding NifX family protein